MLRSAANASQGTGRSRVRLSVVSAVRSRVTGFLESARLIAILRFRGSGDLVPTIDALVEEGISVLEVTLDTPRALDAIAYASDRRLSIGAGTVLDGPAVRASVRAGARFVVSPALVEDVVASARAEGVEPIPGVLSPSELVEARRLGAETVKVFPIDPVGGPKYIRSLRGPFPDVRLIPTGGIAIEDVAAYLLAGATAVGLGSALVGIEPCETTQDLDALRRRAAAAVQAAVA
jgi:2-dehydro-3-deoxyphosphogluconate aldolase / (4S)-4-hydroxy-2-oxoglutarate aldolase